MNKLFNVIIVAVVLFLLFKMGMSVLYFVARFWFIWVALIVFFAIKKRYFSKNSKKESKDYVDADFTIIEDDKSDIKVESDNEDK